MADWQGRIWFVVKNAATVGVLDPATRSIKTLALEGSITNGFSMDRDAAYIVTTAKMYRVEAGPDGAPRKVWEEGYENVGFKKPGQLSAGSGTTPTILGKGKYVAIMDNADQLHVVVYRTADQFGPHEQRVVCEVPVFKKNRVLGRQPLRSVERPGWRLPASSGGLVSLLRDPERRAERPGPRYLLGV